LARLQKDRSSSIDQNVSTEDSKVRNLRAARAVEEYATRFMFSLELDEKTRASLH